MNNTRTVRRLLRVGALVSALGMSALSCTGGADTSTTALTGPAGDDGVVDETTAPVVTPPAASVPRLTRLQYRNIIHDVFGDGIVVPANLEPDQDVAGFVAIGAGQSTISPRGVEQYEAAAYDIASQVFDPERRDEVMGCAPSGVVDEACAQATVEALGLRLWRRPLTEAEVTRLTTVARRVSETLNDFHVGLEYALAAMLQSPSFLFREELGADEADAEGRRWLTDWEMASRLSFMFLNSAPDEALIAAAEAGELTTDEGVKAQVVRLLELPRAREGVRQFFTDVFDLDKLDDLNKDPTVFTSFNTEIGPAAREETLALLEWMVFEEDGDFRDVMTTRRAFVDRKLASMYGIVAPAREGFGWTEHPEDGLRVGLLGHVSVLTQHAHPVSTSATLRGIFVRETLLCQEVPQPPADVDTSIPEPTGTTPTLRDRVAEHLTDPNCAGCHTLVDPLGLALENFDGLGIFRETDNGAAIDTSGRLGNARFDGPIGLAEAIREHPDFGPCMVRHAVRYATGALEEDAQEGAVETLHASFEASGYSMKTLLIELALNPTFRSVGPVSDESVDGAEQE